MRWFVDDMGNDVARIIAQSPAGHRTIKINIESTYAEEYKVKNRELIFRDILLHVMCGITEIRDITQKGIPRTDYILLL